MDDLLKKVDDLPPLPDIVVRLLHASRDPEISTREMVELIKHDPALTFKVLRLCNSSYYGLPRKINSIQEALVYIGTDTLVNFILAGCLSSFYQQAQEGYGLERGELWRHSVGCAIASQCIAATTSEAYAAQAFTAGLLHDVGKIVLDCYVRNEFSAITDLVRHENVSFDEAERRVLGFAQVEAGAKLARHWNLPESLIDAIQFHPEPHKAKVDPTLVSHVHLGNVLCLSFGIGVGSDGLAYTFHPKALEQTGLKVADLYRLSIDVHDAYKKAQDLIGLAA
jgi:HD-like signal output (HDOD) protein